jgi:hypothetical protein
MVDKKLGDNIFFAFFAREGERMVLWDHNPLKRNCPPTFLFDHKRGVGYNIIVIFNFYL